MGRDRNGRPIYLPQTLLLLTVDPQGKASGLLNLGKYAGQAVDIFALFPGTNYLSGATTGFYPIGGYNIFLPIARR